MRPGTAIAASPAPTQPAGRRDAGSPETVGAGVVVVAAVVVVVVVVVDVVVVVVVVVVAAPSA